MNQLTIKTTDLVKKIEDGGIDNLLKPLKKEFFLADVYVEGITFNPPPSFALISEGDELVLKRKNERFNEYAVKVLTKDDKTLGDVDEVYSDIFARLLDAGKNLIAKVKHKVVYENRNVLKISIFLIDY